MADKRFNISNVNGYLVIEKDGDGFHISQTTDNDLWFVTSKDELSLDISTYSREYPEWQTYMVFEDLMKALTGRYILNKDYSEWSRLPSDFINTEECSITWHSDSEPDNVLKMTYSEKTITISITKSKGKNSGTNVVRIRTDGSNYDNYYQEFLKFFREICALEVRLNKPKTIVQPAEKKEQPRRLGLFKKDN